MSKIKKSINDLPIVTGSSTTTHRKYYAMSLVPDPVLCVFQTEIIESHPWEDLFQWFTPPERSGPWLPYIVDDTQPLVVANLIQRNHSIEKIFGTYEIAFVTAVERLLTSFKAFLEDPEADEWICPTLEEIGGEIVHPPAGIVLSSFADGKIVKADGLGGSYLSR